MSDREFAPEVVEAAARAIAALDDSPLTWRDWAAEAAAALSAAADALYETVGAEAAAAIDGGV